MTFASLNDNQVTLHKIKEADGTGCVQNDAMIASKIADGAVTDIKIFGAIGCSKLRMRHLIISIWQGLDPDISQFNLL